MYAPYAPYGDNTKDHVRRSIQVKVNWLRCLGKWVAAQHPGPKPSFLCGDFNVVPEGECRADTLNRSPQERGALISLCASGFVDLYGDFHRDGRPGFNSGIPITNPPDTRLHLILGTASVAPRIRSAVVDLEYRGPIKDLPGQKWAPGASVIVEIDDGVT